MNPSESETIFHERIEFFRKYTEDDEFKESMEKGTMKELLFDKTTLALWKDCANLVLDKKKECVLGEAELGFTGTESLYVGYALRCGSVEIHAQNCWNHVEIADCLQKLVEALSKIPGENDI